MSTSLATTKLSSKGQVVIPEEIRNKLKLNVGDQFIVIGKGDSVILKAISEPSHNQFDELLLDAQKQAKKAKLHKKDIKRIVQKVRKEK